MDLNSINPLAYSAWQELKGMGVPYYLPTDIDDIKKIESMMGMEIPQTLKEFFLDYSCLGSTIKYDCSCFIVRYAIGEKIEWQTYHITCGKHVIQAIGAYNLTGRLPSYLLPLCFMNYASLLVDLRPESYGKIYFHPEIRGGFGKGKNNWKNIGFVADNLVEMIAGLNTEQEIKRKYNL